MEHNDLDAEVHRAGTRTGAGGAGAGSAFAGDDMIDLTDDSPSPDGSGEGNALVSAAANAGVDAAGREALLMKLCATDDGDDYADVSTPAATGPVAQPTVSTQVAATLCDHVRCGWGLGASGHCACF